MTLHSNILNKILYNMQPSPFFTTGKSMPGETIMLFSFLAFRGKAKVEFSFLFTPFHPIINSEPSTFSSYIEPLALHHITRNRATGAAVSTSLPSHNTIWHQHYMTTMMMMPASKCAMVSIFPYYASSRARQKGKK